MGGAGWRGHTLDEALRHLGVQSLRVARLDHVEGYVEEDLGVELGLGVGVGVREGWGCRVRVGVMVRGHG